MSGDLVTLVYFNHARRPLDETELLDLLTVARRNNQQNGITGMLLYHDGDFVQALEGPKAVVEAIFERIGVDPAHDGVISTGIAPIKERQFPEWSMGFLPTTALSEVARHSVNAFLKDGRAGGKETTESFAWSLLKTFREGLARAG
jgi:hypothetical protein